MTYARTNARFAKAIRERMNELGLSIREVAIHSQTTYEHIRKIVRGIAPPSDYMVQVIAEILRMDKAVLAELAVADRIERKFGGLPYAMFDQDPELALLQSSWKRLTAEQKELIRLQISCWADNNSSSKSPVGARRQLP